MMLPSRLGCPLSLKTPNMGNPGINLCPDKEKVFKEAIRVLKPGGRLMLADIITRKPVPQGARDDVDLWTA